MCDEESLPRWICRLAGIYALGAVTAIAQKLVFTEKANGSSSANPHFFRKPVFETFVISIGTFLTLIVHVCRPALRREKTETEFGAYPPAKTWLPMALWWSTWPSLSLLFSTGFTCAGLVWLPVSTWQILQLSSNFFPALFSPTEPVPWNFFFASSLVGVLIGLTLVGVCAIGRVEASERRNTGIAIGLTVGGWIIQSCQAPLEDYLFAGSFLAPTAMAGIEGAFATVLAGIWLLLAWKGSRSEDAHDTFEMLGNSVMIIVWVIILAVLAFLHTWARAGTRPGPVRAVVCDVVRIVLVYIVSLAVATFNDRLGYHIQDVPKKWAVLEPLGCVIAAIGIVANRVAATRNWTGDDSNPVSSEPLIARTEPL